MIDCYPDAVLEPDNEGHLPLHIALSEFSECPWSVINLLITFLEFWIILGKGPPSTKNRVESYARKRYHHGRFIGVIRRSSAKEQ
jgi:hypothetical protein